MSEQLLEKLEEIEKEIRETPYHKGTEHHIGKLRAKLAKLKKQLGEKQSSKSGGGVGYALKKYGDATCVLVGPPSVGKSTLLNKLTRAKSKTGHYSFTTLNVVPGMLDYRGAKIQLFDVPGLIVGAARGKGDGKRVLSTIRAADLIILMTDVSRLEWLDLAHRELNEAGILLDQQSPDIEIIKKTRGNIRLIGDTGKFNDDLIIEIVGEFGLSNAEIIFKKKLKLLDDLIGVLAGNRIYLPSLSVVNKIDRNKKVSIKNKNIIKISSAENLNLDKLKQAIWNKLGFVRIYLKKKRKGKADFNEPLIMPKNSSIADVIQTISQELIDQVDEVMVWGDSVKFLGQKVSFDYQLQDKDIIFFAKRN